MFVSFHFLEFRIVNSTVSLFIIGFLMPERFGLIVTHASSLDMLT